MPEGKNISDLMTVYNMENVKMNVGQRANFVSFFGVCMVLGGRLAKPSIERLGNRGHTTLNNVLTAVAFTVMGAGQKQWNMWLGLLVLLPTMERRAATSAMATDHAVAAGMGKGEYQACFANFRAITVIAAPLFYGRLYSKFNKVGKPGMPWFAGAGVVLLAEAFHQTLSAQDCVLPAAAAEKEA
jgi:hypothetical protein